jgi:hypothetical protein
VTTKAGTLAQENPLAGLDVVFWRRASVPASRSHGCETGTALYGFRPYAMIRDRGLIENRKIKLRTHIDGSSPANLAQEFRTQTNKN